MNQPTVASIFGAGSIIASGQLATTYNCGLSGIQYANAYAVNSTNAQQQAAQGIISENKTETNNTRRNQIILLT